MRSRKQTSDLNGSTGLSKTALPISMSSCRADRDRARAALDATTSRQRADIRIDPALIESFGRTMRENLTTGSTPFRKAYLRSLIDIIEVDDAQIRIKAVNMCWKGQFLQASPKRTCVRSSVLKWRTRHDSNV